MAQVTHRPCAESRRVMHGSLDSARSVIKLPKRIVLRVSNLAAKPASTVPLRGEQAFWSQCCGPDPENHNCPEPGGSWSRTQKGEISVCPRAAGRRIFPITWMGSLGDHHHWGSSCSLQHPQHRTVPSRSRPPLIFMQ